MRAVTLLRVAGVIAVIAGFLFLRGRERAREFSIVPEETVESVKEDVQWAQQRIN